jgi:hypothetical protein
MIRQKSYDRNEAVAMARNAFREHDFQTLGFARSKTSSASAALLSAQNLAARADCFLRL